jgi:hypothetical protein
MNRRQFAVSLPVAGLLIGCDTDRKPSPAPALVNGEVRDALQSLGSAIRNLESNVDRLGDESWLDVVPDVEGAANDLQGPFEALKRALGVADS